MKITLLITGQLRTVDIEKYDTRCINMNNAV
jgi:hypothetical protein